MRKPIAVIGDLHGCYEQTKELTSILLKDYGVKHITLLGDLLDKAPPEQCAKTVGYLRNLSMDIPIDLVLSNHEEKHYRFRKRLDAKDGSISKYRNWEEMLAITQLLSDKDIEWLDKSALYHKIPEYNLICVHAGISPSINVLPPTEEIEEMSSRRKKHFYQMLRVRYVNPNGYMVNLGDEKPEDRYWAEVYDGRFGRCIFGHQPFMQSTPVYYDHAVGIDLGCVFGGKLCALVFKEETECFVTVEGHQWCKPHSYMEDK